VASTSPDHRAGGKKPARKEGGRAYFRLSSALKGGEKRLQPVQTWRRKRGRKERGERRGEAKGRRNRRRRAAANSVLGRRSRGVRVGKESKSECERGSERARADSDG
jgi:hypothetical protein